MQTATFKYSIRNILFLCAVFLSVNSSASHIGIGYLLYDYTGIPGKYLITYKYYSSCTLTPPLAFVVCYHSDSLNIGGSIALSQECPPTPVFIGPCTPSGFVSSCFGGTGLDFKETTYQDTLTLPQPSTDWKLEYAECCSQFMFANLNFSGLSSYAFIIIDNVNYSANSSPRFLQNQISRYCIGHFSTHSFECYDSDGDSLAYELTPVLDYGNACQNMVTMATYANPYTHLNPVASSITPQLDSLTGDFTFIPNLIDEFAVAIKVKEYRNAVLINEYHCVDAMLIVSGGSPPNTITGKTFLDLNSNLIQDTGELPVMHNKVTVQPAGIFAFSQTNGNYSQSAFNSGSYIISPTPINFYNSVPVTHTATFGGSPQTDSLNDFAFQPAGMFNDVFATITPLGNFLSGTKANYMINYGNYGTTTIAPTIIFLPDSNVTFDTANVSPTSVASDSVVWTFPSLSPFQTGSVVVTVNVNSSLSIGTLINSSVYVEPISNDANFPSNFDSLPIFTVASVVPQFIFVSHDTLTTTQLAAPPFLDYIIHFQNTGNDTAYNVKVLNPIDTNKLDLSTFNFVNASHPVNLSWITYQRNMEFKFNNILLPDSNVNEPLSHGFVHYRIKPKSTLLAGDSITNNAYVYFNLNCSMTTNTAVTKIVLSTGVTPLFLGEGLGVRLYPNPAKNELTVTGLKFDTGDILTISDLLGKPVITKTISQPTANCKLQTANLSNGMYLLTVKTKAGTTTRKIIKEN